MRGEFSTNGRLAKYTRDGWYIGWERSLVKDADGGHTFDLQNNDGWCHPESTEFRELTEEDGLQIVEDYADWYALKKWPIPDFPVRFVMPSGRVVAVPFR